MKEEMVLLELQLLVWNQDTLTKKEISERNVLWISQKKN